MNELKFLPILAIVILSALGCGKVDGFSPFSASQVSGDTSSVDSKVKNVPAQIDYNLRFYPNDNSLSALVAYITDTSNSDQQNAKNIHDWIVLNIVYDYDDFNANKPYAYHYKDVLKRRQTECDGFAHLFFKMAKIANLRVSRITGLTSNNHAWNAVYSGGAWMHVDTTWDAGAANGTTASPSYSSRYFWISESTMARFPNHTAASRGYYYDETDPNLN